jgi:parallel beta-helix repeat protein
MAESATHVVDARGGHFTTVGAAISAASPGDRILVRPGLYAESLHIAKPLEIIGDGPVEQIEIRGSDASVLIFEAPSGRVANLTLTQAKSDASSFGVSIRQGRLELEGCDISSEGGSCVYVRGGSDPVLRRNTIHDGWEYGVLVYEHSRGTLEDNEIASCRWPCVATREGGNPVVRRNTIRDSHQSGVYVYDGGLGTFEENEVSGSRHAGMRAETGGIVTARRNRVNNNAWHGVSIHKGGGGTFEDNNLAGNSMGPWYFESGTHAQVTRLRNTP